MKIRDLKQGAYFILKDIAEPKESQVWVRGEYDRSTRTYSATNFSDMNRERSFKGDKEVFVDFTF